MPAPPHQPRSHYHVRPADEVFPGDIISTDAAAIAAVLGDRGADSAVDWPAVEDGAQLVRHRRRIRPDKLRFATPTGPVHRGVADDVLVVHERTDGTRP